MMQKNGEVREERVNSEQPVIGGARVYDIRPHAGTLLKWLTIAAIVFGAVSTCLDWFGYNVAEFGPGARTREQNELIQRQLSALHKADSMGAQERDAMKASQEALRQSQDTIKESLLLFADQFCSGPATRRTVRAEQRCNRLFDRER